MEYGLIGARLGHSFSREIHQRFGRYDYTLRELSPAELGPFLETRAFSGLNVTVPYKQAVIPYLDGLEESARAIGAVNTIVCRNGRLLGYNTDFGGMQDALRRAGIRVSGRKVLILGTGGTSRTALAVCRALGAGEIRRVSRTGREEALTYEAARTDHRDAEILINTTPLGMFPDPEGLPLDPADFPGLQGVFDCVYNPLRTRLVLAARGRGVPAAGGLLMLVRQAALACGLFTGSPLPEQTGEAVYSALLAERENLVLIGMPGTGKTTVGRILAERTGKRFVDTDEEIIKRTGRPISAIFAEEGEAYFRALEAEVITEYAAAGGQVIATGGGAVLRPENVRRLRQNGRLYFLDRPPETLIPSPDRPLGDTAEKLARLYQTRYPLYTAAADAVLTASTAEAAAEAVLGQAQDL